MTYSTSFIHTVEKEPEFTPYFLIFSNLKRLKQYIIFLFYEI